MFELFINIYNEILKHANMIFKFISILQLFVKMDSLNYFIVNILVCLSFTIYIHNILNLNFLS